MNDRLPRLLAAGIICCVVSGVAGCGIDCDEVRNALCQKACSCPQCQLQFPSGSFLLDGVEDCDLVLTNVVCTDDTDSDLLEACQAAVDASEENCNYAVPDACAPEGAFTGG